MMFNRRQEVEQAVTQAVESVVPALPTKIDNLHLTINVVFADAMNDSTVIVHTQASA